MTMVVVVVIVQIHGGDRVLYFTMKRSEGMYVEHSHLWTSVMLYLTYLFSTTM